MQTFTTWSVSEVQAKQNTYGYDKVIWGFISFVFQYNIVF